MKVRIWNPIAAYSSDSGGRLHNYRVIKHCVISFAKDTSGSWLASKGYRTPAIYAD